MTCNFCKFLIIKVLFHTLEFFRSSNPLTMFILFRFSKSVI
nr:MAG TPA: hypothetical protein [Caudoviricetes sp.]